MIVTLIVSSGVAIVPLGFTLVGIVMLIQWATYGWDPTWNDGDGWYAVAAAVILLLVLAATAGLTAGFAVAGHLPIKRLVLAAIAGPVLAAFIPIFLFWIGPRLLA